MENCNRFDKVCLDIEKEFQKQDKILEHRNKGVKEKIGIPRAFFCLVKMYLFGLLQKTGILKRLFFNNWILGWFFDFKKFWVDYLGNRPIDVVDFHFLRNTYRAKFQDVSLDHADEKNPEKFLASWQGQGNIFYLLQSVWNYSKKAYLDCWLFAKYIKKNSHILEYGCSVAPITQGFLKYFSYKNLKFTIADIPQISFLYARWKLMDYDNVESILIDLVKKDNFPQHANYSAIICLAVFEHLPSPLEAVNSFFNHLNSGGILIFDYIKGEAAGMDSQQSMQDRSNALSFIKQNFKILKGKIDFENSMGLTIAQITNNK